MFKNYLLIALRNFFANKLFSAINLLGLSIGLACVIMISLFVIDETSYDQHWGKSDQIYRVMRSYSLIDGSTDLHLATNAPQVGPLLKQDFPQFEHVVRILGSIPVISKPGSNDFYYERGVYYTDADVHEVFDISMVYGQWAGALEAPFTIVLSESLSEKYFGEANPVGETLLFSNDLPFVVTGVMENLKQNSHLSPNAFVSMSTREARFGVERMNDWGNNDYYTYVLTPESYDIQQFLDELPGFMQRHVPEVPNASSSFSVIPVQDIHLNSHRDGELSTNGNATLVSAFAAIALLILAIACFNFMNLSTARSIARADEVGLRKMFGATRKQLIMQFLGESVLLTLVAVLVAVGISDLFLPWVNNMLDLDLALGITESFYSVGWLFLLALGIGILAGSYPAFYMAGFSLARVLKGELETGTKGEFLRKSLVVLQFTISIVLIIASGIALNQIRYVLDLDLGLNTEEIVIYRGFSSDEMRDRYPTMKEELLRNPDILSVTAANLMPSNQNTNFQGVRIEGDGSQVRMMAPLAIDYDFFSNFDIDIISGRDFSRTSSTDMYVYPSRESPHTAGAFILNESAVKLLGLTPEEAIGLNFQNILAADESFTVEGAIIGVTEDVYFSSVREQVKPLFYRLVDDNPNSFPNIRQMAVKVSGNNQQQTLSYIEDTWYSFMPGVPIVQSFLSQNYASLYQADQRQSNLFVLFSALAILIAALGLFGLASYLTEQRTKEIGVRKVLGSTILGIVVLLSKDFCKLVVLANMIAWPIAWYVMNTWMQGFVYRIDIGPGIFVAAATATLLLAFVTVGSLAAVTANRNPIQALRHE